MSNSSAIAVAMALLAVPAAAEGVRNTPPARTELHVSVFGNDPCPAGQGDEIVVCARLPESERFRVPKPLREAHEAEKHQEQSWVARSREIDQAGNETLPSGCSAVGAGGDIGCWQQFMRDARAQKAADAAAAAAAPP